MKHTSLDYSQIIQWVKDNASSTIQIREYQVNCWQRLWSARPNRKRALIHLATGLGKTSVAAIDVLYYLKVEKPKNRVLFVSHMTDISKQAKHTFEKVNHTLTTSLYRSGHKMKDVQITFATFQSLYQNLANIDPTYFSYIIWDEAHHIEALTFSVVREHFNPDFELGLSATPERADGRNILNYFGKPLFNKSLADGIAEGWLSPVDYHIVFDEAIKKAIKEEFDFSTLREIKDLFAIRARNEVISKEVLQRRHNIGMDKAKTIVFCQNMKAAEEMARLLNGAVYHSGVNSDIRLDIFRRFKNGELQVICTVDMFNEGIDIPDARLVVFLRSTSSRTIFEQQLGRGLRRHPGKDKVTVLDFVANVERINFVRELGRHTEKAIHIISRGARGATGNNQSGAEDITETAYFNTSNFEFEDEAIKLLERYKALKATEYLTMPQVVDAYNELKHVKKVAERFGVTDTAIYKHLRRAGIDTSGHLKNTQGIKKEIVEAYFELRSSRLAGEKFGLSGSTVLDYVRKAGLSPFPKTEEKYTDQQIIEAYKSNDCNIRKTSRNIDLNRKQLSRRLLKLGINTSKKFSNSFITKESLHEAYQEYNGDIGRMVENISSAGSWANVYKALDRYGYLDSAKKPITSAQASAAYYKLGNSLRAGVMLGVSASYVSRLCKKAKYIRKYNQERTLK